MKLQKLYILFVTIFLPIAVFGQSQAFFEYVDQQTIELSEKEQNLLNIIKARPQSEEIRLVKMPSAAEVKEITTLNLNLFSQQNKTVRKKSATEKADGTVIWEGETEDAGATYIFIITGK